MRIKKWFQMTGALALLMSPLSCNDTHRKIKFYRNPMNPSVHSEQPAQDSMGMDYIPVYEDQGPPENASPSVAGRASITLTPEQETLTGSRPIEVKERPFIVVIEAPGRATSENQVSFQVYEQDIVLLRPGQDFSATAPSLPGETLHGRITSIESTLDPMTRTARVNGKLSNTKSLRLRIEDSLSGSIEAALGKTLTVPETAVMHTGKEDIVFVTDGKGNYHPRAVRLGAKSMGYFEVKEGLRAGALISSGPNFLIDSEARIRASDDSKNN